jgi:hypothetical protein
MRPGRDFFSVRMVADWNRILAEVKNLKISDRGKILITT